MSLRVMAKQAKVSKEAEADRISSLSNNILCHIISFLPLKEAVCTSILSTRWHKIYTWISILNFNFKNSLGRRWTKTDSYKLMNLVEQFLLFHNGGVNKFHIHCGKSVDPNRVYGWIKYAVLKNVRELDLCPGNGFDRVPFEVFTCNTLMTLKLRLFNKPLKVPVKICLPSLKNLHLSSVQFSDYDSIRRLFSNCLMLEELFLYECEFKTRQRLEVSIPTLKRLTLVTYIRDFEIVINAPSLVYLNYHLRTNEFLPKNTSSLVEVHIRETVFSSDNKAAIDHLKDICNVKSLHISDSFRKVFLQGELAKVTCLNLACIYFNEWERLLPNLLACFPCVEAIKVKLYCRDHMNKDLLPDKGFPSSQLKTVKILASQLEKSYMLMAKYFLKNAKVLENFFMQIKARKKQDPENLWSKITKELLKLPKASKNCEIKVLVV